MNINTAKTSKVREWWCDRCNRRVLVDTSLPAPDGVYLDNRGMIGLVKVDTILACYECIEGEKGIP